MINNNMCKEVECTEKVISELMMEIAQLQEENQELRTENKLLHSKIEDIINYYNKELESSCDSTSNEDEDWEEKLAQAYREAGFSC
jgi:regulator of replication initiation timing